MMIELKRLVLDCERLKLLNIIYDDLIIGEYFADIVELKAAESLCYEHECQLVNY